MPYYEVHKQDTSYERCGEWYMSKQHMDITTCTNNVCTNTTCTTPHAETPNAQSPHVQYHMYIHHMDITTCTNTTCTSPYTETTYAQTPHVQTPHVQHNMHKHHKYKHYTYKHHILMALENLDNKHLQISGLMSLWNSSHAPPLVVVNLLTHQSLTAHRPLLSKNEKLSTIYNVVWMTEACPEVFICRQCYAS